MEHVSQPLNITRVRAELAMLAAELAAGTLPTFSMSLYANGGTPMCIAGHLLSRITGTTFPDRRELNNALGEFETSRLWDLFHPRNDGYLMSMGECSCINQAQAAKAITRYLHGHAPW